MSGEDRPAPQIDEEPAAGLRPGVTAHPGRKGGTRPAYAGFVTRPRTCPVASGPRGGSPIGGPRRRGVGSGQVRARRNRPVRSAPSAGAAVPLPNT